MPLPPYYLEVMLSSRMACAIAVMIYRGQFLKVLFESFSKGPRGFPMYSSLQVRSFTLETVYGPTFVDHGSFVLGGDQ